MSGATCPACARAAEAEYRAMRDDARATEAKRQYHEANPDLEYRHW